MPHSFDEAKRLFLAGVDAFEAGRLAQAEADFVASLALLPGRTSTLLNLATTRIRLGRPEPALAPLDELLAAEPENADAWRQRAIALADLARHAEALAAFDRLLALAPDDAMAWCRHARTLLHLQRQAAALASYQRALAIDPALAEAWTNLGVILKDLGRADDAAQAFREALRHGGDVELNAYYLAGVAGAAAPRTPPRRYVERLFDDYAASFDEHLVGALGYRAHRVLIDTLASVGPRHFRHALDLGCGTGLCAPLLQSRVDRLDGVDLSAPMLDKARARGLYDRLEHADLVEHLQRTQCRHDLVVAADVFIYVGALEPVFEGVRRVLEPGGLFCFSVEQAGDEVDVELRASLRYAHSSRHVHALAARAGFEMLRIAVHPIREDRRVAIAGLYACLQRR